MLKMESCRERQKRLLRHMEDHELELAVLANPKTIYYFSGVLVNPALQRHQRNQRGNDRQQSEPIGKAGKGHACIYSRSPF